MNPKYEEYVKLNAQIKTLEEYKEGLRADIVRDLKSSGKDKDVTELGTFTVAEKKTWTYSDAIKKLADKVKIAKVREEEKGIATSDVTEFLKFTEPKEKEIDLNNIK